MELGHVMNKISAQKNVCFEQDHRVGFKVTLHSYVIWADSPPVLEGLNVRFGSNPAYPRDQRDEKWQRLGVENFSLKCRAVRSILVIYLAICPYEASKGTNLITTGRHYDKKLSTRRRCPFSSR